MMTIEKVKAQFQKKAAESKSKVASKIYTEFERILSNLEQKELSDNEVKAIIDQLQRLNLLDVETMGVNQLRTALSTFEKFLKSNYTLTTKGHFEKTGIALGMAFGLVLGVTVLAQLERSMGIALGISVGMFVGLIIGRQMDAKALSSGRMV